METGKACPMTSLTEWFRYRSDTFQLGTSLTAPGSAGTFNVSTIGPGQQYQGFSTFNKIGPSTWTLTGSGAQNWTISGGTLIGDTNSLQGNAITNNAALVFNQGFNGTYAGSIGGGGAVTVQGGGTVTFTGSNTYSGGTTISGATLQLGNQKPIKVVSEMMGHSRTAITQDLYTHVSAQMQRKAADALDVMLRDDVKSGGAATSGDGA